MLSFDMTRRGELSLYEYLFRCIRDDVLSGDLPPDTKLPSKRKLAEHLGVSLITVEGAYNQLIAEGYVRAEARRGYYVCELPKNALAGSALNKTPKPKSPTQPKADPERALFADFSCPAAYPKESAMLLWGKTLRAALSQEGQEELFAATDNQGSLRLRRAIVDYLSRSRGMDVREDCIVVGAGSQVLYTLVSLLLGEGSVALENPGYVRLKNVYSSLGHGIVPIELDDEGLSVQELERSDAKIAHVMPSHQFPTGRVMSIARRYELLGWASRGEQRYVVEDDYDWEFRFSGMPIPSLQSIDPTGKVIYLSTFSKSLSSALRVAFAVLPPALMEEFRANLGFLSGTVSAFDQAVLARMIEQGDYERHLNRYRKQARAVRDALIAGLLAFSCGERVAFLEQDSGLHFVMQVATNTPEAELASKAVELGVKLAPLSAYELAPLPACNKGQASFVMQYDGLALEDVPRVVEVLDRVFA